MAYELREAAIRAGVDPDLLPEWVSTYRDPDGDLWYGLREMEESPVERGDGEPVAVFGPYPVFVCRETGEVKDLGSNQYLWPEWLLPSESVGGVRADGARMLPTGEVVPPEQ